MGKPVFEPWSGADWRHPIAEEVASYLRTQRRRPTPLMETARAVVDICHPVPTDKDVKLSEEEIAMLKNKER